MSKHISHVALRALTLTLLIACKSGGSGTPASVASEAELQQQAAPVYEALTAIADHFPDMATLTPKACAAKPRWMGGLSWNSLMRVIGREASPVEKQLFDLAVLGDVGRISRLPANGSTQKHINRSNYTEAINHCCMRVCSN